MHRPAGRVQVSTRAGLDENERPPFRGDSTGRHDQPSAFQSSAPIGPALPRLGEWLTVTHMHVAGAIHADVSAPSPQWLERPEDPNALDTDLWSDTTIRSEHGVISVGGVQVNDAVRELGSPLYLLDEADFRRRARGFASAFNGWDVYYAGKAFLTRTITRWVAEEGLCLDVCSGGELFTALQAGFNPARIGMHGNNKSTDELAAGVKAGRAPAQVSAQQRAGGVAGVVRPAA